MSGFTHSMSTKQFGSDDICIQVIIDFKLHFGFKKNQQQTNSAALSSFDSCHENVGADIVGIKESFGAC